MAKANIYIDFGSGNDVTFGEKIKNRFTTIKGDFAIQTYNDYAKADELNSDPETITLNAIESSDIIIPILSENYFSYLTAEIQNKFDKIQNSKNKFFFPIFLDSFDWSDVNWIVKSKMTPDEGKPLSEYNLADQERLLKAFVKTIETAVLRINNKTAQAKPNISQSQNFIFISHDHDDGDFAEILKLRLEKEDLTVWLDNESLKIGQDWREEIDNGIKDAIAVIAIMTPEARKSEYVTYEWAFAWGKGKRIFPLMLKQTQLHPRLESLQYLDFTNRASRPWEELIKELKKLL